MVREKLETYYDILKVDRRATVAEIVSAYHSAKNAFSKDSVATYSLFNPEEVQSVLAKLEEAYLTLSNLEKRVEYDRQLAAHADGGEFPPSMTELERKQNAQMSTKDETPAPAAPVSAVDISADFDLNAINGQMLREIRDRRGLSLDDVARITKIPSKFLRAIEADDFKNMPARVYIQGFVKNLAALYRLDPGALVKAYLAFLNQSGANPE